MAHDDPQSLLRLLHYANNVDIAAIVYHHFDFEKSIQDRIQKKVHDRLDAYERVQNQLRKHDPNFPTAAHLRSVTRSGRGGMPITLHEKQSARFEDYVGNGNTPFGESKDSPGSDLILSIFEEDDSRPFYIQFWGGAQAYAQAVWRYMQSHTAEQLQDLMDRSYLYCIYLQDVAFELFIDMKKVMPSRNGIIVHGSYEGPRVHPKAIMVDYLAFWEYYHLISTPLPVNGHGPLSDLYERGDEGDTPAFLNQISTCLGLNDIFKPAQCGWGGAFSQNADMPWYYFLERPYLLFRYMKAANEDYLARLQWATKDPGDVTRNPVIAIDGDSGTEILYREVEPGQSVRLEASVPHSRKRMDFLWSHESCTGYAKPVTIKQWSKPEAVIELPVDLDDDEIHIVLQVQLDASPAVRSYRRVVFRSSTFSRTSGRCS